MSTKELLSYRAQLVPSKQEIKSEHREEIASKHVEEINVALTNYEDIVQAVVNRYIREDSTTEPLDTTQAPP